MLKRFNLSKGKRGPNISGKPFKTSALITTGVAVVGKLTLGTVYELLSVDDCEALGLDAAYDTANNVVVFEHIDEYFRLQEESGEIGPLYLMVVAQTVTLAQIIDDTNYQYARKMIIEADGKIYNMAIGFNPDEDYTETTTDGLNSEVRAAIIKAQALHDWAWNTDRPVQILLEGRGCSGTASAALNLRAIPATPSGIQENDRVSIVIGQDYDFAETLDGLAQKHAAIGTALGALAAGEVNQDISEVETRNLTDEKKGKWLTAGISSHATVKSIESQMGTYDTKGYIYADLHEGVSGYRFNADATCTPVIVDAQGNMNCHTIAYGRTHDYCARRLRQVLILEVKKVKPVNPTTGKMLPGVVKDLETKGDNVFENIAADGHISGGTTTVDPDSDILVAKEVDMSFDVVPYGSIGKINGTINLKNQQG